MIPHGQSGVKRGRAVTLGRNDLSVECFFNESGRLSGKIERYVRQFTEYAYRHDAKGRLTRVKRDGAATEAYSYNQSGQRMEQRREYKGFSDGTDGFLRYDERGRLARAGETSFYYDRRGALEERCDSRGITRYSYSADGRLREVALPSRATIRYAYDASNPLAPARRFRNGVLTTEFAWADPLRLAAYKDHDNLLEYALFYDEAGILHKIRLTVFRPEEQRQSADTDWLAALVRQQRKERLHDVFGKSGRVVELLCGCDQVGTLKILTDPQGRLVKEVSRDSFGLKIFDSLPDLFLPIGFAGGLEDPDTGLVHFGHRDYDPCVGRFTAPDPLGDTGGDHDLYDYCVDDPVTMNDPSGLFPPLLLFLGAKALALGIAAVGSYGSAWVADRIKSARAGRSCDTAVSAMNKVAPLAAGASAVSALPVMAALGPEAVTVAGQRLGAAIQTSKHGDRIMQAAQFTEGFLNPNVSAAASGAAALGTITAQGVQYLQRQSTQDTK